MHELKYFQCRWANINSTVSDVGKISFGVTRTVLGTQSQGYELRPKQCRMTRGM